MCLSFFFIEQAEEVIDDIKGNEGNGKKRQAYRDITLKLRSNGVGTAAHEIGHALGFFRTQSRNERDSFVTLYTQNFMERNAMDTKKLLEQMHEMEDEINDELSLTEERNAELSNEMKNYVEVKKDHIKAAGDTIEEINQKSNVDTALFQGDMLLTKEQAEEVIDDIKGNEGNRNKRQAYRDGYYPRTLWSNGVYYSFHRTTSREARSVFKKAAAAWQSETCINFSESNTGLIMTEIVKTLEFKDYIMKKFQASSRIVLIKANGCWSMDGWLSQFTKQSQRSNYNYNLTYDYGSVMHYGATSVSKNNKPIMVPRDVKYTQTLGSPIISFYEKLMMNMHYKCLDKCNAPSSATCKNGGFPHPRTCTRCICPSGYGGNLCDSRVKNSHLNHSSLGVHANAPAGSKIEVVLENYTRGFAIDGCTYAGVEIKTGSDKRHTGYRQASNSQKVNSFKSLLCIEMFRFCALENVGTSLVSTHNIVPVITYSRSRAATTVLRYRISNVI
ncbi:unnamed protein product [Angiostrongylus costaricensis]|uniref:Zinc metalloproteinase n=1 Tax=Angiostrongylus costaricensis TaxID=334426 RepID=A0A0R3PT27_ANGCS|nr:unnamed protein product [Angiostrongylus costaricensis]